MEMIPSENAYVAFMRSELTGNSKFFEFKKAHDRFVSENVWSETDKVIAYYALAKELLRMDAQKTEARAAALRKIKNVEAHYAQRLK